jgi:phosphatidylinositol dimannoside acyltransferase
VNGDGQEQQEEPGSYLVMRTVEWFGMRLPRPLGLALGEAALRVQMRRRPSQRRTVAENLARVLGHPPDSPLVDRAVEECYRLYGRYWYETFALRTMPPEEVNWRFTIEGTEHIDRALQTGRGYVLALPHMGNWDAAGHMLCINGYRMTAVAEELKPRSVYELFLRHRRALGMGIVPLSNSSRAGQALLRLLRENEIITLVADRDLTGRGVEVEMFGAPRVLPAGPAYLSLTTGAPLSASAVYTTEKGWYCRIEPPLEIERTGDTRTDVAALTRLLAERFERFIASAPTDWHMFQPFWPSRAPEPPAEEPSPAGRGAAASAP